MYIYDPYSHWHTYLQFTKIHIVVRSSNSIHLQVPLKEQFTTTTLVYMYVNYIITEHNFSTCAVEYTLL